MITAYDKFRNRKFDLNIPVHIFGTSSKGNSVYLSKIHTLIDLGLPYVRYKEINVNFFLDVDYLIITHLHSDHLNPSTLKKILKEYPNVKIIISQALAKDIRETPRIAKVLTEVIIQQYFDRFITATPQVLKTRDGVEFNFNPYLVPHGDVTNIAIDLDIPNTKHHVLYSSDIDSLDELSEKEGIQGIPHPGMENPYDIIFLEANYDEELINEALAIDPHDFKALGNLRHLSEQDAWNYVEHNLDDNGIFIPLHASSTYGTLIQQTN